MKRFFKAISLIVFSILAQPKVQANVENCGTAGNYEVAQALEFIKSNYRGIANSTEGLTQAELNKVEDQISKTQVNCKVEDTCSFKQVGGYHSPDEGNKVNICYHNLLDLGHGNGNICGIVNTLLHEIAHAAGIHSHPNHNSGDIKNDGPYLFGNYAELFCFLKPEVSEKVASGLANIGATQDNSSITERKIGPVPQFDYSESSGVGAKAI